MSNFIWNINFLIFWRLAWLRKTSGKVYMDNWGNIGRLYFTTQPKPFLFVIQPKITKIKNWFANLDNNLL
ncbi:hypothetical protein KNV09_gp083 [Vibrio phage Athena]|uniref:Uncharacterized protein n=7 Tax=Thalassavirus TaxID=2948922 RepID=A0A4Y6E7S4_9CAUD|nr:hypothetical protein KNU52_gp080 [Vibrio phage Achelous]YP_010102514.1 hypothetical protein KNU58_gp074 [Vibrio phage Brizo]YP_010108127.1 hypothetical protein KNV06_gp082 [Vibrio phage AG74]YP_010108320.1 hypothetical protein KNV07_gp084 [Vibrio phage Cody]YP_010108708.1 hypothetical protein KNV09_gp083 [Vibrio phage Athena]YP_010114257.1 hypothetical protein KNV71_gp087 [Vibrio phage Gary]QQO89918.1 hypothetical protein ABURR_83 [Vibrio phage ABurr]WBF69452.1 hypothetical protein IW18_8